MSNAGKRRNRERDAARAATQGTSSRYPTANHLTQAQFAELDERVQRERLNSQEMWDYATALAPMSADTLKTYRDYGFEEDVEGLLIGHRTIGIDYYHHMKLVMGLEFDLIAVDGHQFDYTVAIDQMHNIKRVDETTYTANWEDLWLDLTPQTAGVGMGVGDFLGWLNANAYSIYRAGGPFEDIAGELIVRETRRGSDAQPV